MRERDADETAALLAVQRLQAAYGDVITRRAWTELPALFEPGAVVDVDTRTREPVHLEGPNAVAEFIAGAIERFAFFELAILNTVADVDGDEAVGRVYMCEHRLDHDGVWSDAYGLYQDRYRRHGDDWLIANRQYSSLARHAEPIESFQLPAIDDWPNWPR